MNHKRGRDKNHRAGCLFCKPWKATNAKEKDTLDVVIADQPEESLGGSRRLRMRRKGRGWPKIVRISCVGCGILVREIRPKTRREYLGIELMEMFPRCEKCQRIRPKL